MFVDVIKNNFKTIEEEYIMLKAKSLPHHYYIANFKPLSTRVSNITLDKSVYTNAHTSCGI